jgi:hypothetical protein
MTLLSDPNGQVKGLTGNLNPYFSKMFFAVEGAGLIPGVLALCHYTAGYPLFSFLFRASAVPSGFPYLI